MPTIVVDAEIEEIKKVGVEIRTKSKVEDLNNLLKQGYDAILLAVGTHRGTKLPIPNADLEGVLVATSFLRDVRLGKEVKIGKRVVVLGGGSVGFDCAGTSLRLGANEVHIACLEPREGMLASPEDIEQGEAEGVIIHCSQTFNRIVVDDNGRISGVECLDVSNFSFDREGRLSVNTVTNSEHILPADTVIFAVGQVPELELIEGVSDIKTTRRHTLQVNTANSATGKEGVFAAGDAVSGASSVIEAIDAGRRAAISIDKYLGGEGKIDEVLAPSEDEPAIYDLEDAESGKYRPPLEMLPVNERLKGYSQVILGFTQNNAGEECERCLRCDLKGPPPIVLYSDECWFCGTCVEDCPVPGAIKLQHPLNRRVGWLRKETGEYFRIGMKNPPPPYTKPPIG
jgi:thioredoxin reductase/NAD-dependent dihydropyrimidine dehydrogenase PreA subunit